MPEGGNIPPGRRIARGIGRMIEATNEADQDEALAEFVEGLAQQLEDHLVDLAGS